MPRLVAQEKLDLVESLVAKGMGLGDACAKAKTNPVTFKRHREFKPINAKSVKNLKSSRGKAKRKPKIIEIPAVIATPKNVWAFYGPHEALVKMIGELA